MIDKTVDTTLDHQLILPIRYETYVTVNPSMEINDPAIIVRLSPILISVQIEIENWK